MIQPIDSIHTIPRINIGLKNFDVYVYDLYDVFERTEDDLTPFMIDTFEKQK